MTEKNKLQYLKAKREAFIKLYVEAKIKWISKSIHPSFEYNKNREKVTPDSVSEEEFVTLYERVNSKNHDN